MNVKNERMDDAHEKLVVESVNQLIGFLRQNLQKSRIYSFENIALNVAVGALAYFAYSSIDEEDHELFLEKLAVQLRANFKLYRDREKNNG